MKGEGIIEDSSSMKIPVFADENFSNYLLKFMHSYRSTEHPTVNINNLLFLSGPQKNGKSWFLRHNLKRFEESEAEKMSLVVHYDISSIPNQNFFSFLFNFEGQMIKSIVNRNESEIKKAGMNLLTVEDLKSLLLFRWDKGWIEINLAKSLRRSIKEVTNESPYTFYIENS
jgi:hypothetical protein